MASQSWVNLLNAGAPWQTTQGTQLAASGTATISPQAAGPQDFTLPGQFNGLQWYPNMHLRIRARGNAATGGTTNSTTLFLALGTSGTVTAGTKLCTTAAVVMGATTLSTLAWRLEADIVCTALGSSGNTLVSDGLVMFSDTSTPALTTANSVTIGMPWLATAYNTYTVGAAIALGATMSATFGNIQCNKFLVEQLN